MNQKEFPRLLTFSSSQSHSHSMLLCSTDTFQIFFRHSQIDISHKRHTLGPREICVILQIAAISPFIYNPICISASLALSSKINRHLSWGWKNYLPFSNFCAVGDGETNCSDFSLSPCYDEGRKDKKQLVNVLELYRTFF